MWFEKFVGLISTYKFLLGEILMKNDLEEMGIWRSEQTHFTNIFLELFSLQWVWI